MTLSNQYLLLLAGLFLISCSTSKTLNVERGTGYNFKAGHPEFRASAFGFIDDNDGPTLVLRAEVLKNSFSYKKEGDSLAAHMALDFQIQDVSNSENIVETKRAERTFKKALKRHVGSDRETVTLEFSLQVDPSEYKIVANLQDLNSNKNITQTINTFIPETQTTEEYTLSKIQMYGKQNGQDGWSQINTYDAKGKVDSLRFVFQVLSGETKKRMTLNSRLIRFNSDTTHARPMHYANYSPSSIEYKGIDYDQQTEIQSNQRILKDYGSVFIEYKFENQQRGNYRFEVTAKKEGLEEVYKARAFGIKSKNYPAIQSPRELAKPLVYLMGEDDHEELMSISDPDSLKKEIDRFWLKNIGNASKAKDVIELYYDRVEQANKQFSNFKEGWKTDFGMMYILFGPPWYTEDHLKEIVWFYSYNRQDGEYNFIFNQPKLNNKFFPFYHYLLERHNFYYSINYQQRRLWLTGQILTRRI